MHAWGWCARRRLDRCCCYCLQDLSYLAGPSGKSCPLSPFKTFAFLHAAVKSHREFKEAQNARRDSGVQGVEDAQELGPLSEEDDGDEEGASSKAVEGTDDVINGIQQSSSAGGLLEGVLKSRAPSAEAKPQSSTAEAAVEREQAAEDSQAVSEDGGQGAPWQRGTGPQMLHFRQALCIFPSL